MSKKQKKMLARILIAAALMIGLHFVPAGGMARFILYLVPYLIIGYDILLKAFKGVKTGSHLTKACSWQSPRWGRSS